VLVDGNNHQFERIQHEAGRRGVHVDVVIDFVHVLEYLWKAAEDLHPTPPHPTPPHPARPPARQRHVADMARTILECHASRVVADLNAHARARGLHEASRSGSAVRPATRQRLSEGQAALSRL
jgi:hypothetical protein